jgi:Ser/Thr protein kinase RdoA (MazF antagonist)
MLSYLRSVFGLDPAAPATLTPADRGALGQIWRLELGSRRYAVKELFDPDPPSTALLAAEVSFTALAASVGVPTPASHPAGDGRYVVPAPDGTGWLRLYDWLDLSAPDPSAPDLPEKLGTLVGRLHRCAPPVDREPDGTAPDEWYDVPPAEDSWPPLVAAAHAARAAWAPDLAARLPLIRELTALATPADRAAMILCHRDLHPGNVRLTDVDGEPGHLAVIDWDNLGPADPGSELVRVLLDWFFDHDVLDVEAARETLAAYRATGAPGHISAERFGFAIASRLNFLHRQLGIALDDTAPDRQRDWAAQEIDEALRILPTPEVLAQLVLFFDHLWEWIRPDGGM